MHKNGTELGIKFNQVMTVNSQLANLSRGQSSGLHLSQTFAGSSELQKQSQSTVHIRPYHLASDRMKNGSLAAQAFVDYVLGLEW